MPYIFKKIMWGPTYFSAKQVGPPRLGMSCF